MHIHTALYLICSLFTVVTAVGPEPAELLTDTRKKHVLSSTVVVILLVDDGTTTLTASEKLLNELYSTR